MIEKVKSFVQDSSFQMVITENSLYLVNYQRIIRLEEKVVVVKTKNKTIRIKGDNLKAKKIVKKEMLIEGTIQTIEVQDD